MGAVFHVKKKADTTFAEVKNKTTIIITIIKLIAIFHLLSLFGVNKIVCTSK